MSSHAPTAFLTSSARSPPAIQMISIVKRCGFRFSFSARSKYELTIHRASILAVGQAGVTDGGLIANPVAADLRADGYTVTGGARLTASRFRMWSVSCIPLAGVFQSLDPWGRA